MSGNQTLQMETIDREIDCHSGMDMTKQADDAAVLL